MEVKASDMNKIEFISEDFVKKFDVIVITDNYLPKTQDFIKWGEQQKKKIIIAERHGVYMRVFCDFGDEF